MSHRPILKVQYTIEAGIAAGIAAGVVMSSRTGRCEQLLIVRQEASVYRWRFL
jgi:hypothetical protein